MSWPQSLTITLTLLLALIAAGLTKSHPTATPPPNPSPPPINPTPFLQASSTPTSTPPQTTNYFELDPDDFSQEDDFNNTTTSPTPALNQEIAGIKSTNSNSNQQKPGPTYRVTRVIDGDTIELETGQTVRLIGIDTPESVHPRKPIECFGKQAATFTSQLLLNQTIHLEKDVSNTDRYAASCATSTSMIASLINT